MRARICLVAGAIAFSTALVVSQGGPPHSGVATRPRTPLLYTVTPTYDAIAWVSGGERFAQGATILVDDAKGRRPLVGGFSSTADPSVSFDATQVFFAGKQQASDSWEIWMMPVGGGEPRQVTHCDSDCVRPLALQPDAIVYSHKRGSAFVIEIASLGSNDTKPLQLTFGGSSMPTDVLQDGRVMFQTAVTEDGVPRSELYTVYSDGSGVESYRCDHGASRYAGRQLPSGDIVFARNGGLARFTSAIAHDVPVAAPSGEYAGDVAVTGQGAWLVSFRPNAQGTFELRSWKPGAPTLQPHLARAGSHVIQPVLIAPRPVPNRHPSGLHDWSYANMLCLNAYTSKRHFPEGSIVSARLYTRDSDGTARVLGTAPVEKDGSFFVRVPGDQPLRIELLDAAGRTLHGEAGWFWMRRGEQRICVGCHAGPETAPQNAVPAILLRSTVPADLTTGITAGSAGGH